jgi:hypothetical protein
MEVLVLLAAHANEVVTRDQLIEAVWHRHVSADQLLNRAISELRRALEDQRHNPTYIETIPKRGYRLLGEVLPIDHPDKEGGLALGEETVPRPSYRIALAALTASLTSRNGAVASHTDLTIGDWSSFASVEAAGGNRSNMARNSTSNGEYMGIRPPRECFGEHARASGRRPVEKVEFCWRKSLGRDVARVMAIE